MRQLRRVDLITVLAATALAVSGGCGGGCGGCGIEPIPGGFPPAERNPNAVQLRVTQSGLAALTADPQALISALGGSFNGLEINLTQMPGDDARLVLQPLQDQSTLRVTVRARVRTTMPIPTDIPLVGTCGVNINTAAGANPDIELILPVQFQQDAQAGTTKVVIGEPTLNRLDSQDVTLSGNFGCTLASFALPLAIGLLEGQMTGMIAGAIQEQTCKACPSGQAGECAPFGTACTDNVCMKGNECLQELGIAGRLRGSSVFSSLSPGTTGALDLYEVLGGYATTQTNGIALGMLGGMRPGGEPRDRCGPAVAAPPALPVIAASPFFQGNTRPDTGAAFGIGIGLHASQLEHFAYAAYEGGLLCLTLSANTVAQLSTDTLSLISRSLGKLVLTNSPMAVGLRPQAPPAIVLGKNTFTDDGNGNATLADPLLDISFQGLELDFFAAVDDQYIRVFTVVADVRLPVGLQVTGAGEIAPVLGDLDSAFTNISVKHTEAVTESPQQLADLFPAVLGLVLPQLSGALGTIALPAIGPLSLSVQDITGVPQTPGGADVTYLAIFANLAPAVAPRPVDTRATLGAVVEPPAEVARKPARWRGTPPPRVTLELGGSAGAPLEFSHRIDGGTWSAWSPSARPTIASQVFWLPGTHKIEVRAREVGRPETIDPTPAVVDVVLGEAIARRAGGPRPFHGQPGEGGCECSASGWARRPRRSCSCSRRWCCRGAGCGAGPRGGAPGGAAVRPARAAVVAGRARARARVRLRLGAVR